ncbi:MAG: nicotinate (nicotinamide) nucleotide adenylyltransferase, partial [Clostridia bacterium]|nr:nicotinate (nicotinamide) nucleotide adenylyltransferase [Clostridia bacterium]
MKIIFGGAFNPIHNQHVNMIKHLLTLDGIDGVVVLPSANPPHKRCDTSFSQRVDMIKLALDGIDRIEICDLESKDDGKHYTCEVLPKLKNIYKDIAFVIGGDSLEDFSTWKNPRDIIKICRLYVFTRGQSDKFDEALKYWREQGADIAVCDYHPENVSSTLIRYNAILGEYDDLCPQVADYIKRNGLYIKYQDMISKLKDNIPHNTFEHCSRTAKYALWLNYTLALGLDYDKVLLAGLFHDCAKALCHNPHSTVGVPSDSVGTPVEHQFLGAVVAKELYGIDDLDVLEAIKYHTTGKKTMNCLQKLIFCADMLELGRQYPEVDNLRSCIAKSLDYGYKECALAQYEFLKQKGGDIYPLTLEAIE